MDNLYSEIYTILDRIDLLFYNNSSVIEIKKLKETIFSDEFLVKDIEKLEELSINIYAVEYKELRVKLFNNELIKKYKHIENDLYYLSLDVNNRLKELLPEKKGCK